MAGFTKLFSSLVTSTIWQEDDKTRILWITMLAIADWKGVVDASLPGLAKLANMSIPDCEKALLILKSPDEYSRTQKYEGRRVKKVKGGWQIINYRQYREKGRSKERTEYMRIKQAERRGKLRQPKSTKVNQPKPIAEADTDTDVEEEAVSKEEKKDLSADADEIYQVYPRKVGKPKAIKAINKALTQTTPLDLLIKVKQYAELVADKDKKYIPHPATWFNEERYNDDPAEADPKTATSSDEAWETLKDVE